MHENLTTFNCCCYFLHRFGGKFLLHEKLHPGAQVDSVIIGSKVLLGGELRCQNLVFNDCMYQTKYLSFKLYLKLVIDEILCMKHLYEILPITCFV